LLTLFLSVLYILSVFLPFFFIIYYCCSRGTLWHLWKFLQYIIVEFTLSIIEGHCGAKDRGTGAVVVLCVTFSKIQVDVNYKLFNVFTFAQQCNGNKNIFLWNSVKRIKYRKHLSEISKRAFSPPFHLSPPL
jgi:hypothetical protein